MTAAIDPASLAKYKVPSSKRQRCVRISLSIIACTFALISELISSPIPPFAQSDSLATTLLDNKYSFMHGCLTRFACKETALARPVI